jgi:hypothetical protein
MHINPSHNHGKASYDDYDINDPATVVFDNMPDDYRDAWQDLRDRVERNGR